MAVNVEVETNKLIANRLMITEQQVDYFEEAIEKLAASSNPEHIKFLCQGFDDATEHYEVMFGLVHTIESYDTTVSPDVATRCFINALPLLLPHASGWAQTLLLRILNHKTSRDTLRKQLKNSDLNVQEVITILLQELAVKKPDEFRQKVDEVLS